MKNLLVVGALLLAVFGSVFVAPSVAQAKVSQCSDAQPIPAAGGANFVYCEKRTGSKQWSNWASIVNPGGSHLYYYQVDLIVKVGKNTKPVDNRQKIKPLRVGKKREMLFYPAGSTTGRAACTPGITYSAVLRVSLRGHVWSPWRGGHWFVC